MFYTKYRPQKFSQISRPNSVADALSKQVVEGKTVHAYLFVGPRGTGKTSTARILAKSLNCLNIEQNGDPCNECDICKAINNQSFSDLIELDGASNRSIEDIREIQSKINLAPIQGKKKIYIIDEVHMLTIQAFNALLKTLEEPPKNVTFILCTTEVNKVPETVKSRCQTFTFKRASSDQLKKKLLYIANNEGKTIDEGTLNLIIKNSVGGFRDAETMLQQYLEGGEGSVDQNIGGNYITGIEFIGCIYNKDTKSCLEILEKLNVNGVDIKSWVYDLVILLRSMILLKSKVSKESIELPEPILNTLIEQYNEISIRWVVLLTSKFMQTIENIDKSFIPSLPIEIAIVSICNSDKSLLSNFNEQIKPPVMPNNTGSSIKSQSQNNQSSYLALDKTNNLNMSNNLIHNDYIDFKDIKINEKVNDHLKKNNFNDENNFLNNSSLNINSSNNLDQSINLNKQEVEFLKNTVDINVVKQKWEQVVDNVKNINTSVFLILKVLKPVEIIDNVLYFEVYYSFHKERLESAKSKKIVEGELFKVYNQKLTFNCNINYNRPKTLDDREVGLLTDKNVVPVDSKDILNIFDGRLPL